MIETVCNFSYFIVGIALTAVAAFGLMNGSRQLLVAPQSGNPKRATCLPRLVVAGFCLMMTGYLAVSGTFATSEIVPEQLIRTESIRFGLLMLVVGIAILFTLWVLGNLRNRAQAQDKLPQTVAV